jgi:hypothetical protein
MSRYYYASCYGGLWRFTRRQWQRFLAEVIEKEGAKMGDHGVRVGDVHNVTDITRQEAVEYVRTVQKER